jgi:hypothetical protein
LQNPRILCWTFVLGWYSQINSVHKNSSTALHPVPLHWSFHWNRVGAINITALIRVPSLSDSDSLRADQSRNWIQVGGEIFFTLPARPLGSTHLPVQWVPSLIPGGKAAREWRWSPAHIQRRG